MWRVVVLLIGLWGAAPDAAPPARIVSTAPGLTETLFALGLGDRVVGVSTYCRYPAEAVTLPKVGTFLRPDPEIIARLRPELVVMHASQSGVERQLRRLGIRFVTIDRGTAIADVTAAVKKIGDAAGVQERAAALVTSIDADLASIRRMVAGKRSPRVLIIIGRRTGSLSGLVAVGPGSYLSEVLTIAGGTNVIPDGTVPDYPGISMETVIRLAPDVIIDAADMGDTDEERRIGEPQRLALWASQPLVTAMKPRVFAASTDAFVVPGPRVVEAAQLMARWLHGVKIP